NSYENRVYQIGIEDSEPLVAKIYRPGRWTLDQILEEHSFTHELADHDLSVVAPLRNENGDTCYQYDKFYIALFPRRGGRAPAVDDLNCLEVLGRFIARLHNVGSAAKFKYRPDITPADYGTASRSWLLENNFIPAELVDAYSSVSENLLRMIEDKFAAFHGQQLRLHADCHMGNVLWRDEQPHFVDFDDARTGPAIQDLWMLLSGDETSQAIQMKHILMGYRDFRDFDPSELQLIEPLRTLRMMYHAAWIARRWDDPAFPRAFPFFNTQKYWSEHILELREQWAAIEAPALALIG
ncbi:MAG: serine/threonine protein kinase, partial [Gammaproteobacteria bacterium]|nr:serine/threonine protein kinase [Gammaproteobacteria bacterium]